MNSETVAFQLDSSEQGYFPDPSSLRGGSGNETSAASESELLESKAKGSTEC